MTTVKEDLVNQAVEHLRTCLAAEDTKRGELQHHRAQVETLYQAFTYAQEKTMRARTALDKLLGASGGAVPVGPSPQSGRPT